MTYLLLDFETQSGCDLVEFGLGRHASDPTTLPYCMSWCWHDSISKLGDTQLWSYYARDNFPDEVLAHVFGGGFVVAHNIGYDRAIWNQTLGRALGRGIPNITAEQCIDTAYMARYYGLAGSLAGACEMLELPIQKDKAGNAAMLKIMGNVRATPQTHPEEFRLIHNYAKTDTDAMAGLFENFLARKHQLPALEFEVMRMDIALNDRGMYVDEELAYNMMIAHERSLRPVYNEIRQLTGCDATQVEAQKQWLNRQGVQLTSLDKEHIDDELASDLVHQHLSREVRRFFELKQSLSRTPKKGHAIINGNVDSRMRHTLMGYGAVPTGRWSGRGGAGIQMQNISRPRPTTKLADQMKIVDWLLANNVKNIEENYPPVLAALSDIQRQLFRAPPGKVLIDCDYKGVEARALPWLADDEELLQAFEAGIDPYIMAAAVIFDVPYKQVTKAQRFVGKIAILSGQFGGGADAYQRMAAKNGVKVPLEEAQRATNGYQKGRPCIVMFWLSIEELCRCALDGRVTALRVGRGRKQKIVAEFVDDALHLTLPSGRDLVYHQAQIEEEDGSLSYIDPTGLRTRLDFKQLTNNATQGLCRDLFAYCTLLPLHRAMLDIVHHVHDQVLVESGAEEGEAILKIVENEMRHVPDFAEGLPLDCDGFITERWCKED